MKKQMLNAICFVLGALLGVSCCLLAVTVKASRDKKNNIPSVPAAYMDYDGTCKNSDIVELAYSVADSLRNGDYETLAGMVHPEYGLVLSPYATINLGSSQCFTAPRVAAAVGDGTTYVWGARPDTGEPVQMTAAKYFTDFVYNRDYFYAPLIGVNRTVKSGNALENVDTVFPDGQFVDFCFPGTAEDGLDWSILRLVFEPYEDSWRLSAIIHSEYTN